MGQSKAPTPPRGGLDLCSLALSATEWYWRSDVIIAMIDLDDCETNEIPTTLSNGIEHSNLHLLRIICRKGDDTLPQPIDPSLYDKLPEDVHEYILVFNKSAVDRLPVKRIWDHEIKLKEGFIPKSAKVYPLSPTDRQAVDEWLDEQLQKGYIQESKSPQTP